MPMTQMKHPWPFIHSTHVLLAPVSGIVLGVWDLSVKNDKKGPCPLQSIGGGRQ